jgi:hypothetical protein
LRALPATPTLTAPRDYEKWARQATPFQTIRAFSIGENHAAFE